MKPVQEAVKDGAEGDRRDRGQALEEQGMEVAVLPMEKVAFDAVVTGSGVYAGCWLRPAREFVERHAVASYGSSRAGL